MMQRDNFADVIHFHRLFELGLARFPQMPPAAVLQFRQDLLEEEVNEVRAAQAEGDLVGLAAELADVVIVAMGTAIVSGIHLPAVMEEIHLANLKKRGVSGGKPIKPAGWKPADVAAVLGSQPPLTS